MKTHVYLGIFLIVMSVELCAAESSTPKQRVENTVEEVLSIMRQPTSDLEIRWKRIRELIYKSFDFRDMSQSVLATNWQHATLDQRERFVQYFSEYLEAVYRSKLDGYTDQRIEYGDEVINGDRAVVKTLIVTDTTMIPVDYKMKRKCADWYVYDVMIEGVSLVNNYRNSFSAIVKKDGIEGLLEDVKRRIDEFKKSILKDPVRLSGVSMSKPGLRETAQLIT